MTFKEWEKENYNYDVITTYFDDFVIAEAFGTKAIEDTYERAMKQEKNNYKELTELCLILNHLLWFRFEENKQDIARVYNDLWSKCYDFCLTHLKGAEFEYFYRITD